MKATRRDFLKTASAIPLLSLPKQSSASPGPRRPNILVILVDQMNLDAISAYRDIFRDKAYNCHWLETPNLDRLVASGTSFIESHSADPICSPARASIWTGRMACEHGVIYNNAGIDRRVPNLGEWFGKHSDYRRVYCGKWHAGGAWDIPAVSGARSVPGFEVLPVGSYGNGKVMDVQISTAVEAFIRNDQDASPFLIVAGLLNPHDCCFWTPSFCKGLITASDDLYQLDDELPVLPPNHRKFPDDSGLCSPRVPEHQWTSVQWRNYLYDYVRQIETLDRDVGRMLSAVESRSDETVVIFTSDHGDGNGRHHRLAKWHPYESSVKVPLIISGPNVTPGQVDRAHLVSHVDLVPTICDLAGIPAPPDVRGRSLRPLLDGRESVEWRDDVYYSFYYTGRAVRTERYKYVMRYAFSKYTGRPQHKGAGAEDRPFVDAATGEAARFAAGQSHRFERQPRELLFDIQTDPWETCNLAEQPDYESVLQEHRQRLERWEERLTIGRRFDRN